MDPKYGGMGIHHGNPELLADGELDPLKPEVLVYQPTRHGQLPLGAVEYFKPDADHDLDTNDDLPSLFDVPFDGPSSVTSPACRSTTTCTSGSIATTRRACSRRGTRR
jgi:hypothetical protein